MTHDVMKPGKHGARLLEDVLVAAVRYGATRQERPREMALVASTAAYETLCDYVGRLEHLLERAAPAAARIWVQTPDNNPPEGWTGKFTFEPGDGSFAYETVETRK